MNKLLEDYFEGIYEVNIVYEHKYAHPDQTYEEFSRKIYSLLDQERVLKRSMYGAHLDDLHIQIRGKKAKVFASRGQQKLISLLCKISLATLCNNKEDAPILLIDDFISDFDKIRLNQLAFFFQKCPNQIIITAPFCDLELKEMFKNADLSLYLYKVIVLSEKKAKKKPLGIDRRARNANISNELSKKNIYQKLQLEILGFWAMLNSI